MILRGERAEESPPIFIQFIFVIHHFTVSLHSLDFLISCIYNFVIRFIVCITVSILGKFGAFDWTPWQHNNSTYI